MSYLDSIDLNTPDFADLYDELPLWSAPFGMMLLEHVPLRADMTIVDVGAGTGFLAIELAERCGPRARVIAVDPWAAAADRLRRKAAQRSLANIVVLEIDAAALELPESSVDVIISNLGINNFDEPAAVLKVCGLIAKPNASLLLTTNLCGHMAELYEVYREVLDDMGKLDRIPLLDAHIEHRGTVDSVRALLSSAGFHADEVVERSFRMRFADGSALLRHHFIRLGFLPAWRSIAPPDAMEETFDRLEQRLNQKAREEGGLALTIPMACFVTHYDPESRPPT